MTTKIYIEIDDDVIELNPDYDMDDIIRWTNSDYDANDPS